MTKHRAPLSFEQALQRIAGEIGIERMAEIAGRQPRTVRNWSDPDTPEQVPADCALALDTAFEEAGGVGRPIFEAFAYQSESAEVDRFAYRVSLGHLLAEITHEAGEAHSALALAALPGRSETDRRNAEREVAEAIEALKRALPLLVAQEPIEVEHHPP